MKMPSSVAGHLNKAKGMKMPASMTGHVNKLKSMANQAKTAGSNSPMMKKASDHWNKAKDMASQQTQRVNNSPQAQGARERFKNLKEGANRGREDLRNRAQQRWAKARGERPSDAAPGQRPPQENMAARALQRSKERMSRVRRDARNAVQRMRLNTENALTRANERFMYGQNGLPGRGSDQGDMEMNEYAASNPVGYQRQSVARHFDDANQMFSREYDNFKRGARRAGAYMRKQGGRMGKSAVLALNHANQQIKDGKFPFVMITVILAVVLLFFDIFMHRFLEEWQRLGLMLMIVFALVITYCQRKKNNPVADLYP